jgi:hypothetical protein
MGKDETMLNTDRSAEDILQMPALRNFKRICLGTGLAKADSSYQ